MRNEEQVLSQLLAFAHGEEPVRAVMMNGSRLNSNASADPWQDYDIVFFVRNLEHATYTKDQSWITQFGELCISQVNKEPDGIYILMQFKDGVRIDLCFCDLSEIEYKVKADSLSRILLDKDGLAPELPPPNDAVYNTPKPCERGFKELMNEAWWIMPNIAKGILRDELPYAKYMFDVVLMGCIRKLLCWHIGSQHNWQVNPGYCEKWFKRYLPKDIYAEFIAIFPTTDYDEMWTSLFKAGDFVRKIGMELAERLSYEYNLQEDAHVTALIKCWDRACPCP